MPFGQIEQSWFEDDLWSLHSMRSSPIEHKNVEQARRDQSPAKAIALIGTSDVDVALDVDNGDFPIPLGSQVSSLRM